MLSANFLDLRFHRSVLRLGKNDALHVVSERKFPMVLRFFVFQPGSRTDRVRGADRVASSNLQRL